MVEVLLARQSISQAPQVLCRHQNWSWNSTASRLGNNSCIKRSPSAGRAPTGTACRLARHSNRDLIQHQALIQQVILIPIIIRVVRVILLPPSRGEPIQPGHKFPLKPGNLHQRPENGLHSPKSGEPQPPLPPPPTQYRLGPKPLELRSTSAAGPGRYTRGVRTGRACRWWSTAVTTGMVMPRRAMAR